MTRPLRGLLLPLLALITVLTPSLAWLGAQTTRPILILVGIDGWRWDYLERFQPPAISALARNGVVSDALIPVFPSKTFPNHYTIVTGLHAARHGITSNNMVDPALPGRFSLSPSDRDHQQDTRWWGGEPIWVTAERQGQVAATMFWPGSDVEIAGDRPTYWKGYEHSFPNEARVDQLLAWLDRPGAEQPTFLTLYFSDVDSAGHDFGPDAEETRQAALAVDRVVQRLVSGIDARKLTSRVNYLLVSDHGMAPLSHERVIVLDDYLDLSTVEIIDSAPVVGLNVKPGVTVESVVQALAGKHPSLEVYSRDTLPDLYGLRGHPRLPDIIGIADDGWTPTTREWLAERLARNGTPGGNHGYDPKHRSMHGLFIASGPAFKSGVTVPPFENIHVYELMCRVLGLRPASNDGDPRVTAPYTKDTQ